MRLVAIYHHESYKDDVSDHQVLLQVYQLVVFGMQIDVR